MIHRIPTKDMPREEWLQIRRGSIGGSDAAALLGLNEYQSRFALWAEKSGKYVPEVAEDNEAIRLGNDLEQYVADRFTEATGKRVRRLNAILKNDKYPFAHANIDRDVIGENAGLECKTTSNYNIAKDCTAGKIPFRYYCQCAHYMMVTEAERWYLGVLCFGRGFYHFVIERDEAEIRALEAAEKDFWQQVEEGKAPDIDGTSSTAEAVRMIFDKSDPAREIDLTAMQTNLLTLSKLKAQQKDLEAMIEAQQTQIMAYMGEAERGSCDGFTVTWKSQSRKTFDRKKFETENGAIPEKYYKHGTSRVFRCTETEKEI